MAVAIDAGLKGPKGFETPRAATKTLHLTIQTILAPESQALDWRVAVTPTAFILDSNGVITRVIQFGSGSFTSQIGRALSETS